MPTHDIIDNRNEKLVDHINRILSSTEAALAAAADALLVTGNPRRFPARSRAGVPVLTPSHFLNLLRRSP